MNTARKLSGIAIAGAAAALFSMAPVTTASAAQAGMVHCFGVNACKGQGACKSAMNACKGMNQCKGLGWEPMSAKACKEKGGSTTAPKGHM